LLLGLFFEPALAFRGTGPRTGHDGRSGGRQAQGRQP
jgi:hypothetical protein